MNKPLPKWYPITVAVLSFIPFFLQFFGATLQSEFTPFNPSSLAGLKPQEVADTLYLSIRGPLTHSNLEWIGIILSIIVCFLAAINYKRFKNNLVLVIGITYFFSIILSIFHVLASERFFIGNTDSRLFIPMTYTIAKIIPSLIISSGSWYYLKNIDCENSFGHKPCYLFFSFYFCIISLLLIYTFFSSTLPQTYLPEELFKRPYDLAPIAIWTLSAFFILQRLYFTTKCIYAEGLLIIAIPNILQQVHIAIGSSTYYDHDFNSAHYLQVLSIIAILGVFIIGQTREKSRNIN